QRLRTVRFSVEKLHHLHPRVFLFDGLLKTILALISRDRTLLYAEDGNFPLASEFLRHAIRRHHAAGTIVCRYIRDVILSRDSRVEDRHRNAYAIGLFDCRHERVAMRWGEYDAVDSFVDEVFNDVDLTCVISLCGRALPQYLDVEFLACRFGAPVDGLPEKM